MPLCHICEGESIAEGQGKEYILRCYRENKLTHEQYIKNGILHREDGPAFRRWENGYLICEYWQWTGPFHTFGMMQTNYGNSYKRGYKLAIKDLIKSGKIILRFMKRSKLIKKRYEKIIEECVWWSFPGLGKILLELNGGI